MSHCISYKEVHLNYIVYQFDFVSLQFSLGHPKLTLAW